MLRKWRRKTTPHDTCNIFVRSSLQMCVSMRMLKSEGPSGWHRHCIENASLASHRYVLVERTCRMDDAERVARTSPSVGARAKAAGGR